MDPSEDPSPTPSRRPPTRPAPPRPDVVVEPLRTHSEPTGPSLGFRATLWLWVATAAIVVGLAAVVAFEYSAVRDLLESSVAQQDSTADPSEISDTVTVTLAASAAAALVLLLVGAWGLSLLNSGRAAGKAVVVVAGILTAVVSVTFWSFMSDAGSIALGLLQWGPLVAAAAAGASAITVIAVSTP